MNRWVLVFVAAILVTLGVTAFDISRFSSTAKAPAPTSPRAPLPTVIHAAPAPKPNPTTTSVSLPGDPQFAVLGGKLKDWTAKYGQVHKNGRLLYLMRCKDGTYGNLWLLPDGVAGNVGIVNGEMCDQAPDGYDWVKAASKYIPADSTFVGTETDSYGQVWRFYNSSWLGQTLPRLTSPAHDVQGNVLTAGAFSITQNETKRWELSIYGY